MVQAKDLRIGNLINRGLSESLNSVLAEVAYFPEIVTLEILKDIQENSIVWEFEGIPLTAEWLERLGFVKDEEQPLMPISEMYSLKLNMLRGNGDNPISACAVTDKYPNKREFSNYANVTISDFWASNNMYFVHQIQNAVFALTGEELTIKDL